MKKRLADKRTWASVIVTVAVLVSVAVLASCSRKGPASAAPPNEAARVSIKGDKIRIHYDGREIFRGEISGVESGVDAKINVFRSGNAVSQVILLTPRGRGGKVRLEGTLFCGPESFPCEADRRDRGPVMVRHVSGVSRSLLNRAVYDRGRDWAFSVDAGPKISVKPLRRRAGDPAIRLRGRGR